MTLFTTELKIIDATTTTTQGWMLRPLLKEINQGWRIAGFASNYPQTATVLLTRRKWFWQK